MRKPSDFTRDERRDIVYRLGRDVIDVSFHDVWLTSIAKELDVHKDTIRLIVAEERKAG